MVEFRRENTHANYFTLFFYATCVTLGLIRQSVWCLWHSVREPLRRWTCSTPVVSFPPPLLRCCLHLLTASALITEGVPALLIIPGYFAHFCTTGKEFMRRVKAVVLLDGADGSSRYSRMNGAWLYKVCKGGQTMGVKESMKSGMKKNRGQKSSPSMFIHIFWIFFSIHDHSHRRAQVQEISEMERKSTVSSSTRPSVRPSEAQRISFLFTNKKLIFFCWSRRKKKGQGLFVLVSWKHLTKSSL